ncbi:MAG: acyl-CoA dehydrogenase [Myxococcota bacterium]|nr:acyl-CoA dehydrogenase [Myxococcota bacterium]MDW8361652.1 acyl-CoA dehydrogenase [Myxococcales bacterium]
MSSNNYRVDLREFHFVLFEQLRLGELLGKPPFEAWGSDEVRMVLEETARFAREVLGPLQAVGDRVGCRLEGGQVYTPPGFKEAWAALSQAGWKLLAVSEEMGGQGAPRVLAAAVEELLSGSNTAFNMYAGLTTGAAEVIAQFGTPEQKERYARRMFRGQWTGTMCLTEPHAGSDVGAATTSARRMPDGTYRIKGTKIFISAGDHDLTENIVHLVLARVEGAPPGTRGLSLFIVPKWRVAPDGTRAERNDVEVASIEHKMGLHGSATAVLVFGERDDCVAELVGTEENQGIRQMFLMMNYARIGVGIQGLSIASTAYLNALAYARERRQGPSIRNWKDPTAPKVAIVEHPNVRRLLLDMKTRVDGIRTLIFKLAMHYDRAALLRGRDEQAAAYHLGQVELLTPIVKAYASDQAWRVCEWAIQVYGGAGYLRDHPVEQYARDAKVFSIYEGTNAIQALDLVGRKLGQAGGRHTQELFADIQRFVAAHRSHPRLGPAVGMLSAAHEALGGAAMQFLGWFGAGQMERIPLFAESFLESMSEVVVGWLLLEGAVVALDALAREPGREREFYEGKVCSALHFAHSVLSRTPSRIAALTAGDTSPLDIPEAGFGAT